MDLKAPLHWAQKHPVPTALGVFVIGLLLLWLLGFFGKGSSSSGSSDAAAAFYQASGNQAAAQASVQQSKAAVSVAQLQASTAAAGYAAQTDQARIAAESNLAMVQNNNSTALAINQSNNSLTWHQADTSLAGHLDDNNLAALQAGYAAQAQQGTLDLSKYQTTLQYQLAQRQSDQQFGVAIAPFIVASGQGEVFTDPAGTVVGLGNAGWVGPPPTSH